MNLLIRILRFSLSLPVRQQATIFKQILRCSTVGAFGDRASVKAEEDFISGFNLPSKLTQSLWARTAESQKQLIYLA